MALEEYLKQVRETWSSYNLELVQYQTKCRLIKCVVSPRSLGFLAPVDLTSFFASTPLCSRGWDDLFAKCSENVNSLSAMKLSPYYKVFEDEAAAWEEKLNRVNLLFGQSSDATRPLRTSS